MDRTEQPLLSPRDAARISGCSRSAIMRALASKALPATRGNDNAWLIRREDLDRWIAGRSTPDREPTPDHDPAMVRAVSDPDQGTAIQLAATQARADALAAQVADLRADRDRLLGLVERLSAPRPSLLDLLLTRLRRPAA